jgi:hypothetical protein
VKKSILIAASASISQQAISRKLPPIPEDWSEGVVYYHKENKHLEHEVLKKNPAGKPAKIKTKSEIRRTLNSIGYIILLWDGEDLTDILFEARLQNIPIKVIPIQVTRVVNKKTTNKYDIYIGRGSPWGNPFAISHGEGPDRNEVIEKYKEYFYEKIENDTAFKKGILGMRGMRLACFCKPEACHGDIIADYIDNVSDDEQ